MQEYRAFRLDDAGKIVSCSEFKAENDAEALEIVRVLPEQLGFEVWSGARVVGRIGRDDKSLPPKLPTPAAEQVR